LIEVSVKAVQDMSYSSPMCQTFLASQGSVMHSD